MTKIFKLVLITLAGTCKHDEKCCNGKPTKCWADDDNNCGDCGKKCTGGKHCNKGECK
ncbi:hypothetical protein DM02DRAFT_620544 [Periconia macrospinosa]|uniref:Carbohydrate-binding module family 18 protein n=1 Tax=Periconia macrospinosa TaxID=97972 RepID=A0A2V1D062_9PLEO|nr:hypothetical protein DM02DRAFT_620544 [Periconia macrospinosa]